MNLLAAKGIKMNKLVLRTIFCLVLVFPILSVAQQPTDSDVPDKADVLKFLDLMQAKAQMVRVLTGMAKEMRLGAEKQYKEKVPDATPQQLAKVDELFDGFFNTLPIDQMVDAIVPIYQKHLTKTDLAAITAFYSSPAGQKILREMPAIMAEAMQAGGEIGRRAFTAKAAEFDKKMADLAAETKKD
jgi:hypothetical protein